MSQRPWRHGGIVHVTAEYWPHARAGGLAEAVRGLAEFQARATLPVTVLLPLYAPIRETHALTPVGDPFDVQLGGIDERVGLYELAEPTEQARILFVDVPGFDRPGLYGDDDGDYPDNWRRFALFSFAAMHAVRVVTPDCTIIHAHDWHAALAIVYARYTMSGMAPFDRAATVLTVHNAAYHGQFPQGTLDAMNLPEAFYDWRVMEWYGRVNVLKGAITFADMITTVSPAHATELTTPEGGFGLHEHFHYLGGRLVGVLNGIDDIHWDPSTDSFLTATYSIDDLDGKTRCKRALQRAYGLPQRKRTPIVVMSGRLVEQKGLDLLLAPEALRGLDVQLVVLGRGDRRYEEALRRLAEGSDGRVIVPLEFSERLEHRLLAGADMLLMPSLFEPCGLTQMRAQRYGALPVVRRVGGLKDTVRDGDTGFVFGAYTPHALRGALERAIATFAERGAWARMQREAMAQEFSWRRTEWRYREIYEHAVERRAAR